jgi:hypothetical protein
MSMIRCPRIALADVPMSSLARITDRPTELNGTFRPQAGA